MSKLLGKSRAFRELEIDKISFNEMDLREEIDEGKIDELAGTIADFDILQPILVSLERNSSAYKLILGGRRLRAAKKSGREKIPAFIVDDLEEREALIIMLIENMQRQDLEPLEEARGLAELRDRFNLDEEGISKTIGKRTEFIRDRLALLRLPIEIQQQVAGGRLGVSQAAAISKLENKPSAQNRIAQMAIEKELTVAVVERMIAEITQTKRHYRKMSRKHKVKKRGEPLSADHMKMKLQQIVLRGEKLLGTLDSVPMQRWDEANTEELLKALVAIEQGLQKFSKRAQKRLQTRSSK